MANEPRSEHDRDKTLEDSFPASDPPANSGITGPGRGASAAKGMDKPDKAPDKRTVEEQPTGTPTSDRHATETAHQWEHEDKPNPKRAR